ncbi:MAG: hypothetical protein ACRD01_13890 [Terriglobales bacterium]
MPKLSHRVTVARPHRPDVTGGWHLRVAGAALLMLIAAAGACGRRPPQPAAVVDDAQAAGKTTADFPQTASPVFDAMDGAVVLSAAERQGRNTWLLWTAGDQVFWDGMARRGLGAGDLLKTVDSRQRPTRFRTMGLVNQPGFATARAPDALGIWLDVGPQEPGVDPRVYGRPSGIVGLRIYPNPDFDARARARWDPARFYTDLAYYNDPRLVRPYTVGMACGLCHVSFNPQRPPKDPEHPGWENLASTIGNQYFDSARVFANPAHEDSYIEQLLRSWPRGTVDTSFLTTDNLNDPSNINSIFDLPARMAAAQVETIAGGGLNFPGEKAAMPVPHVLKDGADSVGLVGALSRVYVSIGLFSQLWLRDHNALVGGKPQIPFSVAEARHNSVYWRATADRIPDLASFLARMQGPRLQDAPGGRAYLTQDSRQRRRGKIVFADNCARCHSSKQPPAAAAATPEQDRQWMRREVQKPDFLQGNFLSTDARIPVTVVQTNAARALATNAMRGHIWDNFSSETYKQLPAVGAIQVQDPFSGSTTKFSPPPGGPGYYRVPSLIGIWATAPLLHNNAVGSYTGDPSVAGRMAAFSDAITRLLWPQKRRGFASIARMSVDSYLDVPASFLPREFQPLARAGRFRLGPIPAGAPIDLIASADLGTSGRGTTMDRIRLAGELQRYLLQARLHTADTAALTREFAKLVPDLLKISNGPDFVLDRGHYFGTALSDADKRALIEFLKTF